MNPGPSPKIVGIGEILWDGFPDGDRLGGAPANFAFHAAQLGGDARIISRIGTDEPGTRMTRALKALGLSDEGLQTDPLHATGRVTVNLREGQPEYIFASDVAWDHLEFTPSLEAWAGQADAVCFGTLAQRHPFSRQTIQRFVELCRPSAIRCFDINLRQSFFTRETVQFGLDHATILKLNDQEIGPLAQLLGWNVNPAKMPARLLEEFPLQWIALTLGAAGCELHARGQIIRSAAPRIICQDAVGAGDAFVAALLMGFLANWDPQRIADRANRVGAYVASVAGATPRLPPNRPEFFS